MSEAESSADTPQSVVDGPTPGATLTGFQRDLLQAIAALSDSDSVRSGQAIKTYVVEQRGQETNHGRLYSNLRTLVEEGLVEKGVYDNRTNTHALTTEGREAVRVLSGRWGDAADALGGRRE